MATKRDNNYSSFSARHYQADLYSDSLARGDNNPLPRRSTAGDLELYQIQELRSQTRALVQELWDARRDYAGEMKVGGGLVTPLIPPLPSSAKTATTFPRGQHPTSPKRGRDWRKREPHLRTSSPVSAATTKGTSSPARGPKSTTSWSYKSVSPIRSPRKKALLSEWDMKHMLKQHRESQTIVDVLGRSDSYYQELAAFRKTYSQSMSDPIMKMRLNFEKYERPKAIITKENIQDSKDPSSKLYQDDDGYKYTGVVKVNDRLHFEPSDLPFTSLHDRELFLRHKKIVSDEPPVKVVIPLSAFAESKKAEYKPHRRLSYDPKESVDIACHLHKGYIPTMPKRSKIKPGSKVPQTMLRKAAGLEPS